MRYNNTTNLGTSKLTGKKRAPNARSAREETVNIELTVASSNLNSIRMLLRSISIYYSA